MYTQNTSAYTSTVHWTWQDEAWRFFDEHGNIVYSSLTRPTNSAWPVYGPDDFRDDEEEGGAGVREPRRPRPRAPLSGAAQRTDDEPQFLSVI